MNCSSSHRQQLHQLPTSAIWHIRTLSSTRSQLELNRITLSLQARTLPGLRHRLVPMEKNPFCRDILTRHRRHMYQVLDQGSLSILNMRRMLLHPNRKCQAHLLQV